MNSKILQEVIDCYEIVNHLRCDSRIIGDLWLNVCDLQARLSDLKHDIEKECN